MNTVVTIFHTSLLQKWLEALRAGHQIFFFRKMPLLESTRTNRKTVKKGVSLKTTLTLNFPHHKSFSVNFFFLRSFTDISSCIPYGINTSLFENGGYCKLIIGNVAVNGTPELEDNEEKLRHYETNIQSGFGFVNPPQSCTEKIDDIYCHHYFKRCFIDSPVQTVCREACETFRSVCKKLLAFAPFLRALKINVHVIDCTVLPSRDESSICYDPDTIRG